METGEQIYTIPNTDIDVVVDYEVRGGDIFFVCAEVNGVPLDCASLGVLVDKTRRSDLIRVHEYMSLKDWYQLKLEGDSEVILERHGINVRSDLEEHFNQRSYI